MVNELKGVHVHGEWCGEPFKVKHEVKQYFQNKFAAGPRHALSIDGIHLLTISKEDNSQLCWEFEEEEIKEVVSQCGGTKSLGLDGYNF